MLIARKAAYMVTYKINKYERERERERERTVFLSMLLCSLEDDCFLFLSIFQKFHYLLRKFQMHVDLIFSYGSART